MSSNSKVDLVKSINVHEYNQKVNENHPQEAIVVDANKNGVVDKSDRFLSPTSGELGQTQKSSVLNKMCDIMAPQKTGFRFSADAKKFIDQNASIQEGINGQTILLPTNWGSMPIQSFGIYNEETSECLFNKGISDVTLIESGLQFTIEDYRGEMLVDINPNTLDPQELVVERLKK